MDSTDTSDAEAGGDLTFKKTLDGESAGTQSLILEAGKGNITFEGAVGSESPLKDLTVNGAKTFAALEDITNDGDITLKVIDDIATSNLFSGQFSKIYISLGKIDDQNYDSSGNVTTGSITAQELEILSDGKYTAQGAIETIDGDVDIIALEDITVGQITVLNGASSLVSGIGSITATDSITSDNGFAALARQNITAEDIQSNKNVVILKSSLGQVTVNGEISSYDDVSVSAVNNVVAQKITSQDGAIALISAGGTVLEKKGVKLLYFQPPTNYNPKHIIRRYLSDDSSSEDDSEF